MTVTNPNMSKHSTPTYTSMAPPPARHQPLTTEEKEMAILFREPLTFRYPGREPMLHDISMNLPAGSRCLLVGGNGAGKSTLLRILGGRHMTHSPVITYGKDSFQDTSLNLERALMDTSWGMRSVSFAGIGVTYGCDMPVRDMMTALQAEFPERREKLLRLLRVDLDWRMNLLSDGQRRRVQIFLGLLRPFKLLLLDEVTAVLDIICRLDLLSFLKEETEVRGATVVYATHIFDGLDDWTSHIHFINNQGRTGVFGRLQELPEYVAVRERGTPSPLLYMIASWIRVERDLEVEKEDEEQLSSQIDSRDHAGGYTPGRMNAYIFEEEKKAEREAMKAKR